MILGSMSSWESHRKYEHKVIVAAMGELVENTCGKPR